MTDYKILIFGKRNKYLGTLEEAYLSKATSFDIYFGKRFVAQSDFPLKWTVSKKTALIRKTIKDVELKRLLKELAKKKPKEYRQTILSLPLNLDYRFYNSKGKRISSDSFSQAKFFEIWYKSSSTKKWKKSEAWEFSSVSMSIREKQDVMREIFSDFKIPTIVPPIRDQKFDYTLEAFENGPFVRRKLTVKTSDGKLANEGMALHEIVKFTEPVKITKEFNDPGSEFNKKIKTVLTDEWKVFFNEAKKNANTDLFNFRAKIDFVKPDGEITSQWIQTERFPHPDEETFGDTYYNGIIDLINDAVSSRNYAKASSGATSAYLAEMDFENQIY